MHYKTHNIGPLFVHDITLKKKSPIFHRFPTHEIDAPYRRSNSLIMRLPWTSKGLVMGWWRRTTRTEEETLLEALQGRQMSDEEFHSTRNTNSKKQLVELQIQVDKEWANAVQEES